jgi:hypothetical protein
MRSIGASLHCFATYMVGTLGVMDVVGALLG